MRRAVAERYRDIDFSRARRGAVVKPEPGKTKISIRLDNAVIAGRLSTPSVRSFERNSRPMAMPEGPGVEGSSTANPDSAVPWEEVRRKLAGVAPPGGLGYRESGRVPPTCNG